MFIAVVLSLATFVSTFIGGLIGIKHKDKLHLILGFTAGVLLGVVAFDVLPEITTLTHTLHTDPRLPMVALVVGFLIFHILEKSVLIHHAHETQYGEHKHPQVGILSALALSGHSFLDGVGIGLGFHLSPALGILVAIAVIAHDFSDGLNTVSLMLTHKNTDKRAMRFLLVDALAPVFGALSTLFFTLPDRFTLLYLGFFAGFLLYIGASDVLPEAHSTDSSYKTILMTIMGVVLMYIVTSLIGA